ncbi:FAD-dependent monooxygenase [Serinibacter arcticus]|uniref:2-polyprenyl-6-methoxyphenol hydroxylase n=1 Tax=Serinibacter arcticus TaxID=1655435 RepID=A0A4Z1E5U0_9MICO|nr:FAD-dependent monooxygenase [Serinibacter arcticus]TGO04991.1 2-polyprenyl-6-methoxyphenol hydroxylase [Serinibacter arcticus]
MTSSVPAREPGERAAPRRALVSGASIAGLATAFWLERIGWRVDVVERAAEFREGGQNVDVRGAARAVVDRMGLRERVRDLTTTEEGTRFVDGEGGTVGEFPAREGHDGPTAELEILRGDLAGAVRDSLGDAVTLRFGDTVAAVDDAAAPAPVHVTFASGREGDYDLVVVAEGVRSATRDLVLPAEEIHRDPLDLAIVYGTIPRTDDDDRWWRWYTATDQRQVTLRPDNVGTIRATLAWLTDRSDLAAAPRAQRDRVLREVFAGAGWQTERVLAGLSTSEDVYLDHLTQIRLDHWSRGRVVVVGDAAWCVTPVGGGGSSLALLGGYVLAASLSTAADLATGLREFEAWLRPVVEDTQKLPPGVPRLVYPRSALGVGVLRAGVRLASSAPVRRIAGRILGSAGESERELPAITLARS